MLGAPAFVEGGELGSPAEVVRRMWDLFQARAWDDAMDCFHPDLVVEYPVSRERFESAERFVAMNAAYPEGWTIDVRRIVAEGDAVVSEVAVPQGADKHVSLAFSSVRDGRIARIKEYWVLEDSEEQPDWRTEYSTRF
jgi:ketosteroid isomerase-like protein